MTDFTGTVLQPYFASFFLLAGMASGLLGFIIKTLFGEKSKIRIIFSDCIATLIPSASCLFLTFFITKGVLYAYAVCSVLVGYVAIYFILRKIFSYLKKKNKNATQ